MHFISFELNERLIFLIKYNFMSIRNYRLNYQEQKFRALNRAKQFGRREFDLGNQARSFSSRDENYNGEHL